MIDSMLTSVHILSFENMDGSMLFRILSNAAKKIEGLQVVAITDSAPIPKRDILLKELTCFCSVTVHNAVRPNPQCSDIMTMMDTERPDVVIGIGGGSVLDSAKAVAMLATNGGTLTEYLGNSPIRKISEQSLPLVLLPTTAGTGSEVTKVGVYCDETGRKYTLGSPLMIANTAVLLGTFIDSLPPALCASTGLDALDHALESIWNKNATAITKRAAENAAIEVLTWLPKLYDLSQNRKIDRNIQMKMLQAATLAGIAFSITGTAAGHALSFILSEDWHIPHGTACAFTLLKVFDYAISEESTRQSIARISKYFHPELQNELELINALRAQIDELMKHMAIPTRFSELGISTDTHDLKKRFARSFSDPKMGNQIPSMTEELVLKMLQEQL